MSTAVTLFASVLLTLGFIFVLSGAVGIVRFPDFYTRLHAMGKTDTVGVALMVLAVASLEGVNFNGLKVVFIIFFLGLASPTATHALGRAAHRAGLAPWTKDSGGTGTTGGGGEERP